MWLRIGIDTDWRGPVPHVSDVLEPTPPNVARVAGIVRGGGVVVAPSDTNLALTLVPHQPAAVERAYESKDRPAHKPLTLFVSDPTDWQRLASVDDPTTVERLVERFWPGPLTLVLPATDAVPHERCRREGTVAVGCLSNPVWRDLAARVEGPLAMTSANVSGTVDDDTLVDVEMAVDHVGDAVDAVLAGRAEGGRGPRRSLTVRHPNRQFSVAVT